MAKSQWVIDVTDDTFMTEVVERSKSVPVVVDFWAPWCGPCRALAPLLEQVVTEQAGKVLLAKVNTDENQGLAQQFANEGIPAVYGVRDGKIVNQFLGMLPEAEVRAFVDGLAPTAADTQFKDALAVEESNPTAAEKAYRAIVASEGTNDAARVALARVLLKKDGREAEAAELLKGIEVGEQADEAERLRTILELREVPHGDAEYTHVKFGSDAKSQLQLGTVLAARGDYQAALDALLAAAEDDKEIGRTKVREVMVKIFRVVGSPLADDYRRKLQMMLY